jgi:proton-translocating NADH-quinone oxidoreductase chain N
MPLATLLAGAFVVHLVARLITKKNQWLALLTSLIFALALIWLGYTAHASRSVSPADSLPAWGSFLRGGAALSAGPGDLYVAGIALGLGLCAAIYSGHYLSVDQRYQTYYPLLLLLIAGLVGMVMATDLFNLYLFTELMSVTAYALVAFRRRSGTAVEAGFKYLVIGSAGTLTLLMGIALFYRDTGSVTLGQPVQASTVWGRASVACMLVGLAIKSAIVPAHTWLPDAYERAPSTIASLSGIVTPSVFYALIKVTLSSGYPPERLGLFLVGLGLLNMSLGNLLALVQVNTKRLLAYSSIAYMGYIMFAIGIGLGYNIESAVQAGFFLLLAHAAMKSLAFLSKGVCRFYCGTRLVEELRGTFQQLPLVAVTFSIALIGLGGVPPLAGFAAKWFVLAEVLQAGSTVVYVGLVVFLLNSVISIVYYLPLLFRLFSALPGELGQQPIPVSYWMIVPLIVLSLLVLALGFAPGMWLAWSADLLQF